MFEFDVRPDWAEKDLALRLAEIVSGLTGTSFRPYRKENGGWVLDTSNNWFLHRLSENRWRISHRYGLPDELRGALQIVFDYDVGVARYRSILKSP